MSPDGEPKDILAEKQESVVELVNSEDPAIIFGYRRDGSPLFIVVETNTSPYNLEEFLLEFQTAWWQRLAAKFFGFRILLGRFKKVFHADHTDWFLFWCDHCARFQINYKQGFDRRLDCRFCQARRHIQSNSQFFKSWSRQVALPRDYKVFLSDS